VRYEHEAPGDLLHIDTKKLGRIVRPSHRVTGNRKDSVDGAGWETLFVAIDGHARIAFTAMHPDEKKHQAVQFLHNGVAYYARLGVAIKRLLTDNGSALRSSEFAVACAALGIQHKIARAYRPQTNGHYERVHLVCTCASGPMGGPIRTRPSALALTSWQHHYN
jgi:transposase InsO family protein